VPNEVTTKTTPVAKGVSVPASRVVYLLIVVAVVSPRANYGQTTSVRTIGGGNRKKEDDIVEKVLSR